MEKTQPVFVLGSGRSGTRTMFRMLSGTPGLEIHHEYSVLALQKTAALRYMGVISDPKATEIIQTNHGAAIFHSNASLWIDSSNKLVWLIDLLADLFPTARFVAITRDGRKVVSSFYYKLREEMYDDDSTSRLAAWLRSKQGLMPPPEKKFWWNIPQRGQPFHEEFPSFNRLQRVAYHWAESNSVILSSFARLPSDRTMLARLEDIRNNEASLRAVIEFMGVEWHKSYYEFIQTPRNVFLPLDFQLTKQQTAQFGEICNPMMKELGYNESKAYKVEY